MLPCRLHLSPARGVTSRTPRDSTLSLPPARVVTPVGARLLLFADHWDSITSDNWVRSVIHKGYTLTFQRPPPLCRYPLNLTKTHAGISTALQELLEKRAVERVTDLNSPGFYSRLFLVPKKDGSLRPIIDLSALNSFLEVPSFKMETVSSIRLSIQPGDWAVSLDLSDAYFHVPIHPSSRKYLRFCADNQVFQFRALPFGLATAPRVFTKLMGAVAAHLRLNGSRVIQYFDDWLLVHQDPSILSNNLLFCWETVSKLGLLVNTTKSDLIPAQDFTFVGMNFLTNHNLVRIPLPRIQSLCLRVEQTLASLQISARAFLSLLGILSAAADFVPLGRLHLRPLQFYLHSQWSHVDDLSLPVSISPSIHPHLRWWLDQQRLQEGVPLLPPSSTVNLLTDASLQGWGAHVEPLGLMAQGVWSPLESQLHINNLEMRAVILAISEFQVVLRNKSVLLSTDNSTVVSYIKKQGGTHSRTLFSDTQNLLLLCQDLGIVLSVKHIPGRLNVLADHLSRKHQTLATEWTLDQKIANAIFASLGTPMVDLFATKFNHRLPLYVSPLPDTAAWGRDALSLNWDLLQAYAFPPFVLLPQVLRKVRDSRCHILLLAPLWPQRVWFNDLLSLLHDLPRSLPRSPDLLFQRNHGRAKILLHPNPDLLRLHVWPLSGVPSERRDFLLGQPLSSLGPGVVPPLGSTTLDGTSLLLGVVENRLIHSIPLPVE